jgi:hypothetical protein
VKRKGENQGHKRYKGRLLKNQLLINDAKAVYNDEERRGRARRDLKVVSSYLIY